MAENRIKTKIALKQNTYEYWTTGAGKDYIPLYGEVCLCEITPVGTAGDKNNAATTAPTVLFKVGTAKLNEDGSYVTGTNKKFSELNWASALAADVYDWAKQNQLAFDVVATTTEPNEKGVTYTGNAITSVDWDSTKKELKFTKGEQFATKAELDAAIDSFTGEVGSINDTNTKYVFSIVTEEGDHKGQLGIVETTYTNGVAGTPAYHYVDFLTPDELEPILSGYVKSVGAKTNTAIEVDNTDAQNPKVGLKIASTQGNVTLEQSSDGLKASIDLSSYATKSEMSTAMVFKGTLGEGGTITDLPAATADTVGDTYKVITAGTYQGLVAKVGDAIICQDTPAWVLIPSGDEPSGTVTNVAAGEGLETADKNAITTSGTIKHAVPTNAEEGDHKGTGNRTYITNVKTDKFGHVVGIETGSETDQTASGSATIATVANDVVTLKAGATLSADHTLSNSTGTDITLAKVAKTGSVYDLNETNTGKDKDGEDVTYFILDCNW